MSKYVQLFCAKQIKQAGGIKRSQTIDACMSSRRVTIVVTIHIYTLTCKLFLTYARLKQGTVWAHVFGQKTLRWNTYFVEEDLIFQAFNGERVSNWGNEGD